MADGLLDGSRILNWKAKVCNSAALRDHICAWFAAFRYGKKFLLQRSRCIRECSRVRRFVQDLEMVEAISVLAKYGSIFARLLAAASGAGVGRLWEAGLISVNESVVRLVTITRPEP